MRLIELTQAFLAIAVPAAAIALEVLRGDTPEWLVILATAAVTSYFPKRVPIANSKPTA